MTRWGILAVVAGLGALVTFVLDCRDMAKAAIWSVLSEWRVNDGWATPHQVLGCLQAGGDWGYLDDDDVRSLLKEMPDVDHRIEGSVCLYKLRRSA